jgi:hypothetical protein
MAEELNKFETFKTIADYESNLKSAEKAVKDLDADIKTLNDALDTDITSFTFKGKKYTLSALNDLVVTLEGNKETVENNRKAAASGLNKVKKDNENALRQLKPRLDAAKKERDLAIFQFKKGIIDESARTAAFTKVTNIETDKKKIEDGSELAFAAAGAPGSPATYAFRSDIGATVAPMEDRAEQTRFARMKTGELRPGTLVTPVDVGEDVDTGDGAPGSAVVPTAPVVNAKERTAFVSAQLTARGLENTPANREMLRKEYKTTVAKGKTPEGAAVSNAWETTFRETFPARAWLLDLDRTKYPQLFQLLNTAISQEWYKSPEGLTRFTASLDATDFYKEISQSKQLKTIQSLVGTLGFEGSDFTKFVSDSINFGYDGDILKQKVYEQVFAKDDAGNYVNPTALERTKKSADYISTQNIAKAFFNTNPADSDIENVLTGKILSTDYERQQREFAKTRYGHLSNLLDQGMTLESIASAYKSTASRLLELNPNAIDMSTGAFEQAVTFGEEGKKRLMTNSEWEKLLRTDPQYGWEKTNNAKDEARSLSANIAQAFGRIL